MGIAFLKGHGTENDFVLLPDESGTLELTDARVRALCDRRRGLGADGVLRVAPTAAIDPALAAEAEWFMDYRNADGSIAEMCGNGVRVFVAYLVAAGLAKPDSDFAIGTRAGLRGVHAFTDGRVEVDMGLPRVTGTSTATLSGVEFAGTMVDVGNPHLVCPVADPADLDLSRQPGFVAEDFPAGVNIEFITVDAPDRLRMRVHERGVGETRSCGTGTVAAATAALHHAGQATGEVAVRVPGGEVTVRLTETTAFLSGPAVLLARGELDADWWAGLS